jgi:hypothetical protein
MKILPIENITYTTTLKEEELLSRLSAYVEPVKSNRFFNFYATNTSKPYKGQIVGSRFNISRIIQYGNSFLPRISGYIVPDYQGLSIKVQMRLRRSTLLFLSIWCGLIGFACIVMLMEYLRHPQFEPAMLIPFGMLLFAYLLALFSFKYESKRSKKDLMEILQANIVA